MKKRYIPFFLLLSVLYSCNNKPMDHFVLRGTIPGATDSTEIVLSPAGKHYQKIAQGFIVNGKFELQGKVDQPTYCRLSMNDQDILDRSDSQQQRRYMEIDFFVENGELTFQTPHINSLPESFWRYDTRKEKNYTLTGSPTQEVFYRYQQQTIPSRHGIRQLEQSLLKDAHPEDYKTLTMMKSELERQTKEFIQQNHNLPVNLYLVNELKKEPFTYDQAYLDELAGFFASCQDTCSALKDFRQYLQEASAYVQGKPLEDGKIITSDGQETLLLSQLKKENYTVIDFWASWCGPCRASFPHLREMYKMYGDRVTFISISVDKNEKEWQKALGEEKLPWGQYLATPEFSKATRADYNLTSIPTFLIIAPEGKIIFSGHNSNELETILEAKNR
mgnify:CR=1 FL=1